MSCPSCSAVFPSLRPNRRSRTGSDQTLPGKGNGPVGRFGCRGASARTAWRAGPFAPGRRDEPRTIVPAVPTRARPAGPPRMPAEHARRGPTTGAPAGHAGTMGGRTVATVHYRSGHCSSGPGFTQVAGGSTRGGTARTVAGVHQRHTQGRPLPERTRRQSGAGGPCK